MSRNSLLETGTISGVSVTATGLVCNSTLSHLTKLAKWLSCIVSTYLYGIFDCMLFSRYVRVCFGVNLHSIVAWMSKNSLLETGTISGVSVTATGLVCNSTLSHLAKLAKWLSCVVSTYLYSESTLYSCQNAKELLAQNRLDIRTLSLLLLQILRLFRARNCLTFRQLWRVDSLRNAYVTL